MIDNIIECGIIKKVVGKKRAIFMVMRTLPPPQFEDKFATKESLCQQKENIQIKNSEKCLNEIELNQTNDNADSTKKIENDLPKNLLNDTTTKKCTKCQVVKQFSEFYKRKNDKFRLASECKECTNKQVRKHYRNNPTKIKESQKKYRVENKKKLNEISKIYRVENKEKLKKLQKRYYQENKEHYKNLSKVRYSENKNEMLYRAKLYKRERMKIDHLFKLIGNLRNRIGGVLKKSGYQKNKKTMEILGCTSEQLKEHLEKQFKDGMTWSNHGKFGWHIDHIIPLCSAETEEDMYKLCHYNNLQPLWWTENLSKGGKIL